MQDFFHPLPLGPGGLRPIIQGYTIGFYRDGRKQNGNYNLGFRVSDILVLYEDNGKENGNYNLGFRVSDILVLYEDNGKENGNYNSG